MSKPLLFLFAFLLIATTGFPKEGDSTPSADKKGSIIIRIIRLKSSKGLVRIGLFNSRGTFSRKGMEFRSLTVEPESKSATAQFDNIPFGEYAVSLFHDENNDHTFNKGLYLAFRERYGFSNNARPGFGPPEFEKAKFTLNSEAKAITIKAQ